MEKGTLAGRVVNQKGEPVADAAAMISSSSQPLKDIAALTDENGEFSYRNLAPGIYTVMINAEGYGLRQEQVRVESGEAERVTFTLGE